MRASNRTSGTAVFLFCAAFSGCDGGGQQTGGVGGDAGSGGSNGPGTGGTCNTGTCGTAGTGGAGGNAGDAGDAGGTGGAGGNAGGTGGTAGAGGNAGHADAGFDHREDGDSAGGSSRGDADAGARDADVGAGDADTGAGDAEAGAISCSAPITGTTPFGAAMFASVSFPQMDGGTLVKPVNAQLYFPAGRVPGAAVVLAGGNVGPGPIGATVARGTLDSSGNVGGLTVSDSCGNGIADGTLSDPSLRFTGTASQNTDPLMSSDAIMIVKAPARLCPNGAVPDAVVVSSPSLIWPTQRIALVFTTPIDLATRSSVKIMGSDRALVVSGGETQPMLSVTPQSDAFAPGDWTLDLSGLRDVLGRTYAQSVDVKVQMPPNPIVDRTLTTPPTGTAWISSNVNLVTQNGLLVLAPPTFATEYAATIALGDEPGSKTLHVKHRWVCGTLPAVTKHVTLVATDGASVDVPANCASAPEDAIVTLAGTGPYFLVVHEGVEPSPRCFAPTAPARDGWELDEFTFAP